MLLMQTAAVLVGCCSSISELVLPQLDITLLAISRYDCVAGNWEFMQRATRKGLHSGMHIGWAFILFGSVVLFDIAHGAIWQARNSGVSDVT